MQKASRPNLVTEINDAFSSVYAQLGQINSVLSAFGSKMQDGDPAPFAALLQSITTNTLFSLKLGKVNMVLPWLSLYRVSLEKQGGDVLAVKAGSTGGRGTRDTSVIEPDSLVVLLQHRELKHGVILCSLPRMELDASAGFSDAISQANSTGVKKERVYTDIVKAMSDNGELHVFSGNSPEDQIATESFTRMASTGICVHVSETEAILRVSEVCGVLFSYIDGYARFSGINTDIETAVSIASTRKDEKEIVGETGYAVYPWEMLGGYTSSDTVFKENDATDVQHGETAMGRIEPEAPDTTPFFRRTEYFGYMGQGMLSQVVAPPDSPSGPRKLSDDAKDIGVFQFCVGLDGAVRMSSSSSIFISKQPIIVAPKRKRIPESPMGDSEDSGYDPTDHKMTPPKFADEEMRHIQQPLIADDIDAYFRNWKALHPFYYHEKDYETPEEGDVSPVEENQIKIDYGKLKSASHLPVSETASVKIDDRYGEALIFKNKSMIALLDDGGILIRGAGGEEICLSGGNIYFNAPGDIWNRPGKNANTWAGKDVNVRAKGSVDVVATTKDVRLKSSVNMQLLAGNSGKGGMTLESRGEGAGSPEASKYGEDASSGGVLLRADKSFVSTIAKDVYLRSGGNGDDTPENGNIFIDANKGDGIVTVNCSQLSTYSQLVSHYFGTHQEDGFDMEASAAFSADFSLLSGTTTVDGQFVASDGMLTKGNLIVDASEGGSMVLIDGTYLSTSSENVAKIKGDDIRKQIKDAIKSLEKQVEKFKTSGGDQYDSIFVDNLYSDEGGIGSDNYQTYAKFSYRDDDGKQYGTEGEDWWLPAASWQIQVGTGQATGGEEWEEEAVKYAKKELYPYPGKKKLVTDEVFLLVEELKLVDPETGNAKERGEDYEDVEWPEMSKKTIQKSYKVLNG